MESTQNGRPTTLRKILRLIWKIIPFFAMVIVCLLIIIPMSTIMKSKKEALAKKRASQTAAQKALTNVITLEMRPGPLREKLSFPGIAKPWISLNIVAEVSGKIVNRKAAEGRQVNKGDVLAIIDKRDYQNAYNSALASWETAKTSEKRLNALVKKNFVTKSQLDDAVAMGKTTKAALDNARLNLKRCTILSPMSGVINRVHIENGSFLSSGDPVVQILQLDKLKITVGIPESDVSAVRKIKSFNMIIDALGGKSFTGSHHYLYKTADSLAMLYNLEIKVDNLNREILPDMFARVDIIKQSDPKGLAVPMYALVTRGKDIGVFVEENSIARYRRVKTGFQDGWKIQIPDGLNPGEKVVVVGHQIIEDNEKINVARSIIDMEELTQ